LSSNVMTMTERKDILLDDSGDLLIEGGDFVIGQSDQQHILHILQAAPGQYKQHPMTGANAVSFVGGSNADLKRNIRLQLLMDGYDVKKLSIENGKVRVEI